MPTLVSPHDAEKPPRALSRRIPRFLAPAYMDEARFLVQAPKFHQLLASVHLSGACLNAGCGEMMYLDWLDSLPGVTHFTHMDLITERSNSVRGNPRHDATPGSVTDIPFPDGAFGFVFCTEVLEHVPDHHKAATEISRVLQPGGIVLISTPTPPAPFDPNHVREGYTLAEMTSLLSSHGLKVLRHEYAFFSIFRKLYETWTRMAKVRGGISGMPRFLLRAWSGADRTFPFGAPWDIMVLAQKAT